METTSPELTPGDQPQKNEREMRIERMLLRMRQMVQQEKTPQVWITLEEDLPANAIEEMRSMGWHVIEITRERLNDEEFNKELTYIIYGAQLYMQPGMSIPHDFEHLGKNIAITVRKDHLHELLPGEFGHNWGINRNYAVGFQL